MFEEWKFERQLAKLQKLKRQDADFYKGKIKEAADDEVDALLHEANMERDIVKEQIDALVTRYLTDEGQKLLVPIPDQEEGKPSMWERTAAHGRLVLSPLGVKALRDGIHEEMKKRTERRFLWLQPVYTLVSLLVALGGLAVAFVSLWLRKP